MSTLISVAEKINQAIALLGGATAQSYSAVGLSGFAYGFDSSITTDPFALVEILNDDVDMDGDSTLGAVEKPIVDLPVSFSTVQMVPSVNVGESTETTAGFIEPVSQNYELLSRFETSVQGIEGFSGASSLSGPNAADAANLSEATEAANSGFSLPDFLGQAMEQAIAQAEPPQQEFGGAFDGSREVEQLGSLMNTVAQPIGSSTVPTFGTFLPDPREELFVYLS